MSNIQTTFISLSVFYIHHATKQCLDVMRTAGDQETVALDLTSRERQPYNIQAKKKKEM